MVVGLNVVEASADHWCQMVSTYESAQGGRGKFFVEQQFMAGEGMVLVQIWYE